MRGIGLIIVLLALLVIGILTITEMQTETVVENTSRTKSALIDQSKKAAQSAEASLDRYKSTASKLKEND